jgi:uncharacterized protein YkwD
MPFRAVPGLRPAAVLLIAAFAAGCVDSGSTGSTYRPQPISATGPVSTDISGAVSMVNSFRRQHGLGPVRLNPQLNAVAASQARAMAAADRMSHGVAAPFQARMASAGYDAGFAGENIGAGYANLELAMEAWENSSGHRQNLLQPAVTEIGVAGALAPNSKYRIYWSMVMATPYR